VTIDVGELNGHYFAHAAILGLNVDFARRAQRLRGVVGRMSYPIASLLVYQARTKVAVTIENGARSKRAHTYQLAVVNSPSRSDANAATAPSGGHHALRIQTVQDFRLRTILRDLPRIFFHRHLGLPGSESFELQAARILTPEPAPVTLDGEIKTTTPAHVRVVPNGLRVIVARAGLISEA
jgi:diacylglycerol kinase family enzyme